MTNKLKKRLIESLKTKNYCYQTKSELYKKVADTQMQIFKDWLLHLPMIVVKDEKAKTAVAYINRDELFKELEKNE